MYVFIDWFYWLVLLIGFINWFINYSLECSILSFLLFVNDLLIIYWLVITVLLFGVFMRQKVFFLNAMDSFLDPFIGLRDIRFFGDKLSLKHPSFKPANVFLLAGTNNIPHLNQSPGKIFMQYNALIVGVKEKFPMSNVQVISILPRGQGTGSTCKKQKLNLDLPAMVVEIVGQRISKLNKLLQTNTFTLNYPFIGIHVSILITSFARHVSYEFNDNFSLHLSHHGYSLLYEHITRYNYPSRYLCQCSTFNV